MTGPYNTGEPEQLGADAQPRTLDRRGHRDAGDAEQPVVQVSRRTETGEAPAWQGATTENTGSI